MKSKAISILLILSSALLVFLLASCGNNQTKSQITFGENSNNTKSLNIVNNTNKTIKAISAKNLNNNSEKSLEISGSKQTWENNDTATIYLEVTNNNSANTQQGSIQLKTNYDLTISYEDGNTAILHSLPAESLADFKDAKLNINSSDNLTYIQYTDSNGESVSTLASEQKILNEQIAAQQAAAQAAAEQQAVAKSSAMNQTNNNSIDNTSRTQNNSQSSSSQSTDSCTGGNVLLR